MFSGEGFTFLLSQIDAVTGQKIFYKDIPLLVKKLAAYLWNAGLRKGDVLCVIAQNHIYYPLVYLAVMSIGGVITDVNPSYRKGRFCLPSVLLLIIKRSVHVVDPM